VRLSRSIEATLIPELWLLDRHHAQLNRRGLDEPPRNLEVLTTPDRPLGVS
jgi:hypothetical protein